MGYAATVELTLKSTGNDLPRNGTLCRQTALFGQVAPGLSFPRSWLGAEVAPKRRTGAASFPDPGRPREDFAMTKGKQSAGIPNRVTPSIRAATGRNAERGRFEEAAKAADAKASMANRRAGKRPFKTASGSPTGQEVARRQKEGQALR